MKQSQLNQKLKSKKLPDSKLERDLLDKGYSVIIGIDEVGRGCWAGPVYVGSFAYSRLTIDVDGVNDSKKLSGKRREGLHKKLTDLNQFHIEIGSIDLINKSGIGKTITFLIENILEKFNDLNAYFLIDGQFSKKFGENTRQIIRGDGMHYSIAAASIIAKVERDKFMTGLAKKYDKWMFEKNKGYGTQDHITAIEKYGICDIHRTNYKPIMEYIEHQKERRQG